MALNQAVILVGGRGVRLGNLTETSPKPMMAIGDSTFLEILVDEVARHGFREIILLCGYQADSILSVFAGRMFRGAQVRCIVEDQPMGTAGALVMAADHLDEEFLLLNGDSLLDINLLDLVTIAPGRDWMCKVALRQLSETGRFGTVVLDGERIVSFAEKAGSGPGVINGGVYLLKRAVLDLVRQTPCSLEREVLPLLADRGLLFGRPYQGYFIDIGLPVDLARAQAEIPGRRRPVAFLDRDGVLNHDYGYVHRSADFHWTDGAIDAIKLLNDRGWLVIVVTNQAGVARGYYDETTVVELHAWMQTELMIHGAHVDAFYHCPHHPDGVVPGLAVACECRKPQPGMLLTAAHEWQVALDMSFLIGDKDSDLQAAAAAGVRGLKFSGDGLYELVAGAVGST